MNITLNCPRLGGVINAPPSKSVFHRVLICAAAADGVTDISCASLSDDIRATARCLCALGSRMDISDSAIRVYGGFDCIDKDCILECGESGSTLRFMIPVAAALGKSAVFKGKGRLSERPVKPLCDALKLHSVNFNGDRLPLEMTGKLSEGDYRIRADISSQFITGLLLALPLLKGDSVVITEKKEVSAPYIDITLDVLKKFGAEVLRTPEGYAVKGMEKYHSPETIAVEGDYSNAAFWLVCGAIGKLPITCMGLDPLSVQGDRRIIDILNRMGGKIEIKDSFVTSFPSKLHGSEIDAENIPDLVPVICVAASAAEGRTVITNTARLRKKESDRVEAVVSLIRSLGGKIEAYENRMEVFGTGRLSGGKALSFGDHRIVMSAAVASVICSGSVTIEGAEAAAKSYPEFFTDFHKLERGEKI